MTKNKKLNSDRRLIHLLCCFCVSLLFIVRSNVANAQLPDEKNDQQAPSNKTSNSSPKSAFWGQPVQGQSILNIQPLSASQSFTFFTFNNNAPVVSGWGSSRTSNSSIGLVSLEYEFGILPEMAMTLSTGFYSSTFSSENTTDMTIISAPSVTTTSVATTSKSKSSGLGDTSIGIKNDFLLGGAHFINGIIYRFSSAKPLETKDSETESSIDSNASGSLGDFSLNMGTYFQPARLGIIGFSVAYTGPYTVRKSEKNAPPDSKTVNEYKYKHQSLTQFSAWVETTGRSVAHIVSLNYAKGGDSEEINLNTNTTKQNKNFDFLMLRYTLDAKINQNFHLVPSFMTMTNTSNPYSDSISSFTISLYAVTLNFKFLF